MKRAFSFVLGIITFVIGTSVICNVFVAKGLDNIEMVANLGSTAQHLVCGIVLGGHAGIIAGGILGFFGKKTLFAAILLLVIVFLEGSIGGRGLLTGGLASVCGFLIMMRHFRNAGADMRNSLTNYLIKRRQSKTT